MSCDIPTFQKQKTPDIKTLLSHGNPSNFMYPRPIPLQVRAADFDEIQYACSGCGGEKTNDRRYIEEAIGLYDWKLDGKGSLNKPYKDLEDGVQDEIDRIRKEIAAKSAALAEAQAKKAELDATRPAREAALDAEIARLEADLAAAQSELGTLSPQVTAKQSALDEATRKLNAALAEIDRLQTEIDRLNGEIDDLEDKINGKPSGESEEISARLDALTSQLEARQTELAQLKIQNENTERTLSASYDLAVDRLVAARQNLANIRAQVTAKQDEILALENRLYANPALQSAMLGQANVYRLARDLQNQFFSGGLPPTQELLRFAQEVFQSPSASARENALELFVTERDRLLNQLGQQCSALSQPSQSECVAILDELTNEAQSLADTLTNALSNPEVGGTPEEWRRLDELRDELKALEAQIRQAEQAVTAAEQAVTQAQQVYINGIDGLQQSEIRLTVEITRIQAEFQTVSEELTASRAKDEQERIEKTPDWLDEIAALRTEIERLEAELAAKRLEAEIAQVEQDKLADELRELRAKQRELQGRVRYLEAQLQRKRDEKARLADETAALEAEIRTLETAIAALEAELKRLLAGITSGTRGHKSANGQQAFFIPPPLEETDGFDKAGFETAKALLAEKEAAYAKARAAKGQLQKDAYSVLRGFTEQLWALKLAKKVLAGVDDEIAKLTQKKQDRQVQVVDEHNDGVAAEMARTSELGDKKNR